MSCCVAGLFIWIRMCGAEIEQGCPVVKLFGANVWTTQEQAGRWLLLPRRKTIASHGGATSGFRLSSRKRGCRGHELANEG